MCIAGAGRKAWQVKNGSVNGAQNATVGYNDRDAGISWLFVGAGEICGDEVASAAGVSNGKGAKGRAGTKHWSGNR